MYFQVSFKFLFGMCFYNFISFLYFYLSLFYFYFSLSIVFQLSIILLQLVVKQLIFILIGFSFNLQ